MNCTKTFLENIDKKCICPYPCVVDAVTETIIMVACVRICDNRSLFLICSKSLPNSLTAFKYSISPTISESSSGKRFWYLFLVNLWMRAIWWKTNVNERLGVFLAYTPPTNFKT